MSLYYAALFLHIVGALGLFAALALEWAGLSNLRRARTGGQFRDWAGLLQGLRRVGGPSGLTLIVTGIYLTVTRWGPQPWIILGLIGLFRYLASGDRSTTSRDTSEHLLAERFALATGFIGVVVAALIELQPFVLEGLFRHLEDRLLEELRSEG